METVRSEWSRREPGEAGLRVVLPRRPRRPGSALLLLVFGAIFAGVPGWMILQALTAVGDSTAGTWTGLGLVVFCVPFVAVGLGAWLAALASLGSRVVVELTPDELRATEHVGPLRWTRRRSADRLRSLAPFERTSRGEGHRAELRWCLRARFASGKPFDFAGGYPRRQLVEAARHLREGAPESGLELAEEEPSPLREAEEAPSARALAGSDIRVQPTAGGLAIEVPPAGLWKGSKGLFPMGGCFVLFVVAALVAILVTPQDDSKGRDLAMILLFCCAFLAVGAGLMLTGWNFGRRSATLELDEEALTIERRSPFGTRRHRYPRASITEVLAGPSGLTVNDVPVLELQIFVHDRKALGMLSQRSDVECRALARRLRGELFTDGPGDREP